MFKEQITPALMLGNLFEIQMVAAGALLSFVLIGHVRLHCILAHYRILCIVSVLTTGYYVLY